MKKIILLITLFLITGCSKDKIEYQPKNLENYKLEMHIKYDKEYSLSYEKYNDDIFSLVMLSEDDKISYIKYKDDFYSQKEYKKIKEQKVYDFDKIFTYIDTFKKEKTTIKVDGNKEYKSYTFKFNKTKEILKILDIKYKSLKKIKGYYLLNENDKLYKIILINDDIEIHIKPSNYGEIKLPLGEL